MAITSPWAAPLQLASFKGISFEVSDNEYEMQRRPALHEFPFADLPSVEDLGLGVQHIKISGFLIGDDVYAQRDAFVLMTKQQGQGELIHPSLGSLTVTLLTAGFSESVAAGRSVGINLTFVITGDPAGSQISWQDISSSTPDFIQTAVANVQAAMNSDFVKQTQAVLQQGAAVVSGVASQVGGYVAQVRSVIGDASRIVHSTDALTSMISGQVGSRYSVVPSGNIPLAAISRVLSVAGQQIGNANQVANGVSGLIGIATQGYGNVMAATNSAVNLVSLL
jgi:prophage DNA circulation protein